MSWPEMELCHETEGRGNPKAEGRNPKEGRSPKSESARPESGRSGVVMNPEMPQKPQDESEAQLTSLLLGELPHEQAAALHQKLVQDAELAKLYERLKHTINLVRESVATPAAQTSDQPTPLKLSADRREKLLQHFKTVAPIEFIPIRRRAMPWLVP